MRFRLAELITGFFFLFLAITLIYRDCTLTLSTQEAEEESSQDLGGPDLEPVEVCPVSVTPVESAKPQIKRHVLIVKKGDTPQHFLNRAIGDPKLASQVMKVLHQHGYMKKLILGRSYYFYFKVSPEGQQSFEKLIYFPFGGKVKVKVILDDAGNPHFEKAPLAKKYHYTEGQIDQSLYAAAKKCGTPIAITNDFVRLLSHNVDFQRSLRTGDTFQMLIETYHDEETGLDVVGELLYGALKMASGTVDIYRFTTPKGGYEYYNSKGEGTRKSLLKTPVPGARLSGRYGMRKKHPVLGYAKMHRGVDFAAPRGTPILAAGAGVVKRSNRFGSYGNYVMIQHDAELSTAYAHLSGFAKGIRSGQRVKQGQVIGYVGATGRATGPHLHYEVLRHGKQINPQTLKLPSKQKLTGKELKSFYTQRQEIDAQRGILQKSTIIPEVKT